MPEPPGSRTVRTVLGASVTRRLRKTEIVPVLCVGCARVDLLPRAAQRKVVEEVRRAHMLELIMNGTDAET